MGSQVAEWHFIFFSTCGLAATRKKKDSSIFFKNFPMLPKILWSCSAFVKNRYIASSNQKERAKEKKEIIKFHGASFFLPNHITFSIFKVFSLQPTWPPFGRLTDIQVSTHPLPVAESQTGSDETTPDQIRRVVRPLTLINWFLALL